MVSFNFTNTGPTHYGYDAGVNAANLTMEHIKKANARLEPLRQQRIAAGLLKATSDDPSYVPPAAAKAPAVHVIHYAKWTKKELVTAIVDKRLKSKSRAENMNKSAMVATLEKADKNPKFHRFLALSPELRNNIYEFAIEDLNSNKKGRVRPKSPAISRTNRQLRMESLPLFLRNTCLTIVVSAGSSRTVPLPQRRTTRIPSGEVTDEYKNYFIRAERAGWLQHMRHFQWRVMGRTLNRDGGVVKCWNERYFVDFSSAMQTVTTSNGEASKGDKDKDKDARLERAQNGMAEVTDNESTSMTALDFYSMMAFFMDSVVRRTPN